LASGVGFVAVVVLEGITRVSSLLDVAEVVISRRCSAKAMKHENIRTFASYKLNTVQISKALEDCGISDARFKLIVNEVDKYCAMKEEICQKTAADSSVIDEGKKTN
jgi:hypothetical protein